MIILVDHDINRRVGVLALFHCHLVIWAFHFVAAIIGLKAPAYATLPSGLYGHEINLIFGLEIPSMPGCSFPGDAFV